MDLLYIDCLIRHATACLNTEMKWKLTACSIINLEKEKAHDIFLKIQRHIKLKPQ
jgi:hypothetical protein